MDYRTISATVRPPRIAAFINRVVVLDDNLAAAELVELAVESKTDEDGGSERAAISKYMELPNAIGATQCVFATSQPQWSADTVHNVEQQFRRTRTRPVYLSHRELYSS